MNKTHIRIKQYITSQWETKKVNRVVGHHRTEGVFIETNGWFFTREIYIPLNGPDQPYQWEWS